MDKYYYLACELPFLTFGKEIHITGAQFLDEAEKWLSRKDLLILSCVDINDYSLDGRYPRVLREYKEFEFNLRKELSLLRTSSKVGLNYKDSGLFIPLTPLIKDGNPLEVEKRLLYLRWEFIEEMEGGHYFDLEFLILYFLKLQVLERLYSFNKDKGLERFNRLCEVDL